MKKKQRVKIEILRNSDQTGYEVYLDGNRILDSDYEFQLIVMLGLEYFQKYLPLRKVGDTNGMVIRYGD